MRLEHLTAFHLRRAVELYLELAYPPDCGVEPRLDRTAFDAARGWNEVLAAFEVPRETNSQRTNRYALRLGNHRYQHMKLVVQEYLIAGEYFFSVDTHDNLDVRPGMPDYERFQELRVFNRELKDAIESAWKQAGLPTYGQLRELCESLGHIERDNAVRERILVVDDEKDVALGLAALLGGRGYAVEIALTGEDVLASLERGPLPDLIVLDLELPRLGGREVLEKIRARPQWAKVPVMMATASEIDLGSLSKLIGCLRKPYTRDVLLAFIRRMLEKS